MNVDISGGDNPTDFSQGPWVTMLQDLDMDGMYSHIVPVPYTAASH